jgi:NTE family protein
MTKPTAPHADTPSTNGTKQVLHQATTWKPSQTVLVLQGGGALGAYQAGVYQALQEAGIEPDWVIGTSIGAINGSLIAGNEVKNRLPALQEFWKRMAYKSQLYDWPGWEGVAQSTSTIQTIKHGIPGFFEPNPLAFLGGNIPLGAEQAGYYSTAPLEKTLLELVDFSQIKRNAPRLTVGAAHVRSSQMKYFDGRDIEINVKHIMASGALPPAFPAVRIDGELYWDGGILSNTPSEIVFDDHPRRNSLLFAVHLWHPNGPEPVTMLDVAHRLKDIQYSSRVKGHIVRQQQTHTLRHIVKQLLGYIPETVRNSDAVRELAAYGCMTQMHVVRLLAPRLDNEDQSKDVDFSPTGIRSRWEAGLKNTRNAIEQAPWQGTFDPAEGIVLHEPAFNVACESAVASGAESKPVITTFAADQPHISKTH